MAHLTELFSNQVKDFKSLEPEVRKKITDSIANTSKSAVESISSEIVARKRPVQ
jgi:hypothetical protein